MKTRVDLFIDGAAQLVTCAHALESGPRRGEAMNDIGIIPGGALAVNQGLIVAVGPSEELQARFEPQRSFSAEGMIVCPGFVEAHTQVVYAGNRITEFEMRIRGANYLDILKQGGGIQVSVQATRSASTDELVYASTSRLEAMLQAGTTTVEVKTGYGLDLDTEIKMLRVTEQLDQQLDIDLVPTFLGAHAVPPEYVHNREAYTSLIVKDMLPAVSTWYQSSSFAERGVPLFNDVFCEDGAFSVEQSRTVLEAGRQYDIAAKVHADEFTSLGGVPLAIDVDAVSVDHLDVTTINDIDHLSESNTVGVLLPAVTFNLGKCDYADGRRMIDSDVALALATDANPGSAPCLSIPLVMAIACRYQGLTPAEALNACTINAAFAVGMEHRIGSIEVGKQADLLIIDAEDYRHLAYRLGENLVKYVFKRGQLVVSR